MYTNDTISDLIVNIKNGYLVKKTSIHVKYSKTSLKILKTLITAGFIRGYSIIQNNDYPVFFKITVFLKYNKGVSTIKTIQRVSRPGRRVFTTFEALCKNKQKFYLYVLSTPAGIITMEDAKKNKIGGEVLFRIS